MPAPVAVERGLIGERVLRPAMVGVAKGGPKVAEISEPGANSPFDEKDA